MRRFFITFAALAAMVSCVKDDPEIDSQAWPDESHDVEKEVSFIAYAPMADEPVAAAGLRSVMGSDGKSILWENGDRLKVAYVPNEWYSSSSNAIISDNFRTSMSQESEMTYFSGTIAGFSSNTYSNAIVFYPHTVSYSATKKGGTGPDKITETISFDLSSVQVAGKDGSFGKEYNLSSARADAAKLNSSIVHKVAFLNACAWLRVELPEDLTDVISVSVASNTDVPLTGRAYLVKNSESSWNFDTDVPGEFSYRLTSPDFTSGEGNPKVELSNGGNAFDPVNAYNIVVWPGVHESGLTFTFTDYDGRVCRKNVSANVEFTASKWDRFDFSKANFVFSDQFEISTGELDFGAEASDQDFTVLSSRNWTIEGEDVDWLTFTPSSGTPSSDAATISVSVEANTEVTPRTTELTVMSQGMASHTVTVTQAAFVPELVADKTSITMSEEAETSSFEITSNLDWTIGSVPSWLTVNPSNGSGSATVSVSASKNSSASSRTATLTISNAKYGVSREVVVAQDGFAAEINLSETTLEFTDAAASSSFSVTSNVDWEASSNQSWLTLSPASGSASSYASGVTVNVTANTSYDDRTAVITVTGGGVTETISVTQEGVTAYKVSAGPLSADKLVSGKYYVVVHALDQTKYWQENSGSLVLQGGFSSVATENLFLEENVFEISSGYSVSISGYSASYSGYFKSVSLNQELTMNFTFAVYGYPVRFGSWNSGDTNLDVYSGSSGSYFIYYDHSAGKVARSQDTTVAETVNGVTQVNNRKWYIYEVEEVK